MNFYAFKYEKKIDFQSIEFHDSEYVQTIKKNNTYFFLHQKLYGHNYPDDWSDQETKETKRGVVNGLEQLKEQIFILINIEEQHIYSSLDSSKKTNKLIEELLQVEFKIYHRLVEIDEFESKISKLTGIVIKPQSLQQKTLFTKDLLNFDNQIIDLSEAEDFKLDINYDLKTSKRKVVKMYEKLVDEYNVGEVTFKGSNDDNLFQFNNHSIIQKIPVKLSKNGEGNIFDYKEVYELLTNQL
ncbi:hypothetical protein [Polaribacter sp. 11A2H]|uniref:hypothetical protein n=1 Tax=Polaribacter sp. 11A2H TaxID=2687290 RepID=UPI001408F164|nr:hypothetical protein [Polaribacter sp. 11A2H]